MNNKKLILLFASITLALIAETAIAGPGGFSSSSSSSSGYRPFSSSGGGGGLLGFFLFFLLPFFVIIGIASHFDSKKKMQEMNEVLGQIIPLDSKYEWENLQVFFQDLIRETYQDWQALDTDALATKMTHAYFQEQNQKYLKEWKNKGLTNICDVKEIKFMMPYGAHFNHRKGKLNGVTLSIQVTTKLADYLVNNETDEIIQGDKYTKSQDTYWTFQLENGEWKIAEIAYKKEEIQLIKKLKSSS
ncbi:hypothetical protein [Photobacterium sp. 1_MG-2023]|uniref:hypothetical protein n=1 Tax=Photobacterium sp. 1_MG-2023 TaxID=3062646 RepID=UPI0026E15263|nr:hypothetical protein [Photobacterium sp. 1_MG-2023]MDO6707220.1 hypothetical protein [Photobacterium sp. 1_MG-2023]